MYYYNHHINDFKSATANLDDHQLATYLRMIWACYDTEQPLAGELEDIAFAVRSDEKTVRLLLRHYFMETPEGWVNQRCEREISEYRSKSEKAKKSAKARWSNAGAMRTHTDGNADESKTDANQEPITDNQEPSINNTKFAPLTALTALGVDEQVAKDYIQLRKASKAVVTQTVINGIAKESAKAGIPMNDAIAMCVVRGWRSFKSDWVAGKQERHTGFNERNYHEGVRDDGKF